MRIVVSLVVFLFCLPASSAPPHYTVTDLGALPIQARHQETVGAFALNDSGQVVGGGDEAWRWAHGKKTSLGVLAPEDYEKEFGTRSVAYGLNNRGQIVGASGSYTHLFMGYNYFARAVRFDGDLLTTLSDSNTRYEAYSINDRRQIVGQGAYRAFFFDHNKLVSLGTLSKAPQGNFSEARCINNHGQVVGSTTIDTAKPNPNRYFLPTHAFLWRRGVKRMHDLGVLPGYSESAAEYLNDRGRIVGSCQRAEKDGRYTNLATLWANGKTIPLNALPRSKTSEAFGVNNHGQIVGYSSPTLESSGFGPDPRPSFRAVLWQNGRVYDLNACLSVASRWVLERAQAINNKGWIAGDGTLDGHYHAFLLTPLENGK